ncbi:MAG: YkgJ family cysteine cluster protein [Sedimentisphaerales bacterium]|nr:YkgJ family cysteine cluster protein [Sedimentisphaerales bacterium]
MQSIGQERACAGTPPAIMLCDRQGFVQKVYPHCRFVPFELDILGRRLSLSFCYFDRAAGLAEMVPMSRALSDLISRQMEIALKGYNKHVSCRRGCSHCCYYMVPVSLAEAFQITEETRELPDVLRQQILRSFQKAGYCLLNHHPPKAEHFPARQIAYLRALSDWYRSLHLACPFLVHHVCGIYHSRPLTCREYWALSDPSYCHTGSENGVRTAPLPVRIAEVLSEVCTRLTGTDQTMLLPLSVPFVTMNSEQKSKTWPAGFLVDTFLTVLFEQIHRNSLSVESPPQADRINDESILQKIVQ